MSEPIELSRLTVREWLDFIDSDPDALKGMSTRDDQPPLRDRLKKLIAEGHADDWVRLTRTAVPGLSNLFVLDLDLVLRKPAEG